MPKLEELIKDQRSREFPIQYIQIHEAYLKKILDDIKSTQEDLESRNVSEVGTIYTIKTSEGGYSGPNKETFLSIFSAAKEVQSIEINLLSEHDQSLNQYSYQLFLHAESYSGSLPNSANRCFAFGKDEIWVKNTYLRMKATIEGFEKAHSLIYSTLFEMSVQLAAVIAIVAIATWGSSKFLAEKTLPGAEVYAFVAIFLLASNAWAYFSRGLVSIRERYFPAVGFKQVTLGRRLIKLLIGIILPAVSLWGIDFLLDYFLKWPLTNLLKTVL